MKQVALITHMQTAPLPEYLRGVVEAQASKVHTRGTTKAILYIHEADEVLVVDEVALNTSPSVTPPDKARSKEVFQIPSTDGAVVFTYDRGARRTFGPYQLKHVYASLADVKKGERDLPYEYVDAPTIETDFGARCRILKAKLEADLKLPISNKQKGK
jgi:hypothetical protein